MLLFFKHSFHSYRWLSTVSCHYCRLWLWCYRKHFRITFILKMLGVSQGFSQTHKSQHFLTIQRREKLDVSSGEDRDWSCRPVKAVSSWEHLCDARGWLRWQRNPSPVDTCAGMDMASSPTADWGHTLMTQAHSSFSSPHLTSPQPHMWHNVLANGIKPLGALLLFVLVRITLQLWEWRQDQKFGFHWHGIVVTSYPGDPG